jgi:hypothetical protein
MELLLTGILIGIVLLTLSLWRVEKLHSDGHNLFREMAFVLEAIRRDQLDVTDQGSELGAIAQELEGLRDGIKGGFEGHEDLLKQIIQTVKELEATISSIDSSSLIQQTLDEIRYDIGQLKDRHAPDIDDEPLG